MMRLFVASLFLSLGFALALPAATAFAQTCTPACSGTETCVYTGLTEDPAHTQCIPAGQNGDVNELVVTGTKAASTGSFKDIVNTIIIPLGNLVVALLMAIAFLLFIFGIFKYFFVKGSDEKARAEGRGFILWSIIALAILFSLWGLVRLVIGILPPA
jgi:hypothetical protein